LIPLDGVGEEEAEQYRFFHQLTRLSRERGCLKHDDRLDAYAMAVSHAQRAMGIDPEENMKEEAAARWNDAMDRYLDNDRFAGHRRWDTAWTSDEGAYRGGESSWV